jgi:hypothetical protein
MAEQNQFDDDSITERFVPRSRDFRDKPASADTRSRHLRGTPTPASANDPPLGRGERRREVPQG